MRSTFALILAAFISLSGIAVVPAWPATVEEGVSAAFAVFKQALAARDGPAAARYIDDRTAAYYEKIRRAALRMPKNQLLRQPLFFQFGVLSTRLRFREDEIAGTDGRGFYAKLAADGAAGISEALNSSTLIRIQPTRPGASAIAHVSLAGRPEGTGIRVFSQGGAWKIDLTRFLEAQTKELQSRIGITSKMPAETIQLAIEKDYFPVIAQESGKPASENLWTPLAHAN